MVTSTPVLGKETPPKSCVTMAVPPGLGLPKPLPALLLPGERPVSTGSIPWQFGMVICISEPTREIPQRFTVTMEALPGPRFPKPLPALLLPEERPTSTGLLLWQFTTTNYTLVPEVPEPME